MLFLFAFSLRGGELEWSRFNRRFGGGDLDLDPDESEEDLRRCRTRGRDPKGSKLAFPAAGCLLAGLSSGSFLMFLMRGSIDDDEARAPSRF